MCWAMSQARRAAAIARSQRPSDRITSLAASFVMIMFHVDYNRYFVHNLTIILFGKLENKTINSSNIIP